MDVKKVSVPLTLGQWETIYLSLKTGAQDSRESAAKSREYVPDTVDCPEDTFAGLQAEAMEEWADECDELGDLVAKLSALFE